MGDLQRLMTDELIVREVEIRVFRRGRIDAVRATLTELN